MSQKANPDRQIAIGGKTYTLRYSALAIAALQDHWGVENMDDVLAKMARGTTLKDLQAILWAGLRSHHSSVTLEDCLGLLDEIGMGGIVQLMSDAFGAALPPVQEAVPKGAAGPTRRGRSTGSSRKRRR